jgi:glycerol-3-phosphate dehydrogenase
VCLSGPTHAEEVAKGLPTLIVAACEDINVANQVRDEINNEVLRVYSNDDIKGAEVAGALKNIMALACGMSEGMGYGDNAKAALITRGLTEMTRLGEAMGCKKETFYGLTGIGDIVVTATSKFSRNHNAGVLLGQGKSLKDTLKEIGMVVEGINALLAAKELRDRYNVSMPIVEAVYSVIYDNVDPKDAVVALFNRRLTVE